MMDIIIKDNFLPLTDFLKFKNLITKNTFEWYLSEVIGLSEECIQPCHIIDNYQFTHLFYYDNIPQSRYYEEYISPFISLLNIKSMLKAKINLNPKTEKNIKHGFHIDTDIDESFTSILYFNNTNGYTEFKNGEKVQDVKNRLVTFPSHLYHTGNTCTDNSYRIVLNLNYY